LDIRFLVSSKVSFYWVNKYWINFEVINI
jgi:hypothetical protein